MQKILKFSLLSLTAMLAMSLQASAATGVTPAGVENYDGSFTYDNPQVLVDGASIPIVNDGSNYNAAGFCALQGKFLTSLSTGSSPGGNVADLSQTGQLIDVSAYSTIITSLICSPSTTSSNVTLAFANSVGPSGNLNFDGSVSYDNPVVSVDGAYIPIVNDGSNYNAIGFCALQNKTLVSMSSGTPTTGGQVADISQTGKLVDVSAYTTIVTNLICR